MGFFRHKFSTVFIAALAVMCLGNLVRGAAPLLSVGRDGTNVVVNFTGWLQSAQQAQGPYMTVFGATSPSILPTAGIPARFWRARLTGPTTFGAGATFSGALKTDGTLWVWGGNHFGQLGIDGLYVREPQQVGVDSNWMAVTCGMVDMVALKSDGSLWQWGGSRTNRPTRVGLETDWTAVSSGHSHAMALKTDGSLWAWGYNLCGELGTGTDQGTFQPAQVGVDTNWKEVACGFCFHASDQSRWQSVGVGRQ